MVTNLKEETTESWINIWKIKQGNEKIVETSQEKQTENQALQETKVWLFMVEKKKKELEYVAMTKKTLVLE